MTRDEAIAELTAPGKPYELAPVAFWGRRCRAFVNAPPTLRDLFESTRSDKPFFVYEDERYTFEDMWRRSCRLAEVLADDYGVGKGDRVAFSCRNYPEWVVAFVAATSLGAIAVAMNALWQPKELEYGLGDCEPRVFIGDQERMDRLSACDTLPSGMGVIAIRPTKPVPSGVRLMAGILAGDLPDSMPAVSIAPDDDAIMLYTSGSTGHPKGAVSSHRNVISALLSWELDAAAAVLMGRVAAPAPGGPQASTLLGAPLFHVTGSHAILLASYRAQRRVVSMYKWDPAHAAELIERERITSVTAPAAMTGDLVRVARESGRDLSSLLVVGGGGAPRAPEQVRAIDKAFGAARPGTGWGMTETNAIGAGIGGDDYLARPESSGRAAAVLDLRIVDEAGNNLPPMQRGELQVRGASIFHGYWRRPEANAATFDGEWLRTGDVAYLDDEGFVFIVDRIKDLVIRGGENIGCGAVEAALLEHPAVLEASVYGVPDERLGEELAATVHAGAPVSEDDLRAFLSDRLAKFEIPRYFHFQDEPLPRIASGKILKRQLRDEAAARLAGPRP